MLKVIRPDGDVSTAQCIESDGFITLSHAESSLPISTLPRVGNYSETVFLNAGALGFVPSTPSVLAAHITIQSDSTVVTLFAIDPVEATQ